MTRDELEHASEADVAPRNHPDRVDRIDGALGELSQFHRTHGFYVHGLPIESATLPSGWQDRAVPVSGRGSRPATGWCLEAHDLAASKLVAGRAKDRAFVRVLIVEELVSASLLVERIRNLRVEEEEQEQLIRWVRATGGDLASQAD